MNIKNFFILSLTCIAHLTCIAGEESMYSGFSFPVFAIPGQDGEGSDPTYVQRSTRINEDNITLVETPKGFAIDLGQNNCMKILEDTIPQDDSGFALHATAQGAATALNYLGKHPEQQYRVLGIMLESPLASGNSTIHHNTVTNGLMGVTVLRSIPLSYYWLPYLAKFTRFFSYSPAGPQAIDSIEKIKTDAPIIIAHSKENQQLSYQDACALYHGLRKKGNPHVYFLSQEGSQHLNLMYDYEKYMYQDHIKKIVGRHGLHPYVETESVDFSQYQPDHTQDEFKIAYESLKTRERRHRYLSTGVKVALAAGALKLAHYYLTASPTVQKK